MYEVNTENNRLLLIDDSPVIQKIVNKVLKEVCEIEYAQNAEEAFSILDANKVDLILLDVEMPKIDGFETIKLLKKNEFYKDIPVIFLTSKTDLNFELEAFALGAVDFITKPFMPPLLIKRVKLHLTLSSQRKILNDYNKQLEVKVAEKTEIIKELQNAIVFTLAEVVEMRDGTTGGHINRTQSYYACLLKYLQEKGIYKEELNNKDFNVLIEASQLHDIGKVAISDSILLKPAKLTAEEFEIMKTHTTIGQTAILRAMDLTRDKEFLQIAAIVAYSHHEKWDGSGYPTGVVGTQIPVEGRIMAVVDVYDALVSERPYKQKLPHNKAMEILKEGAGTHFDPKLIEAACALSSDFEKISGMY